MRRSLILLAVGILGVGCSTSDRDPGWAIVRVEADPGVSPLQEVCIAESCQSVGEGSDIRTLEHSAFVEDGSQFEVLLAGQSRGGGTATGRALINGCVLVRVSSEGAEYISGCGEE